MFTEPQPGVFNFTEGEIVSSMAAQNGQLLRCHALVWHNQLAPWVENTTWTPDALRDVITRHITNVMNHWKGQCYAWDVVNEALNDDGTFRASIFYNVLGADYIKHAFNVASQIDPKAKLYYNDYGLERPNNKTAAVKNIVKTLKDAGIKIDGVGLQAHLHADVHPTIDEHILAIKGFTNLGVEVALTELDVRIAMPVNATNLAWQREEYRNVRTSPVASLSLSGHGY
jgi:endo-1,4-beta-xylanase